MHNSTEFLYGWKMLASCTTQHKYEQYLQSPPLRKKNELPCHFFTAAHSVLTLSFTW